MSRTLASTRSGYRASLGSGTRRMNTTSSAPPATPTIAPTASWSRNAPAMPPAAPSPSIWSVVSRLAIRAMPTGSLAPDSPSRMVPLRPVTSRRPTTENTTAGSVGASAVPSSNAARHSRPNRMWARTASAAAVTKVPATPTQTTGPAAWRNRRQPLDGGDRHLPERRHHVGGDRRGQQEDRGRGDPDPVADPVRQHRRHDRGGGDQRDQREVLDVAHRPARVATAQPAPKWFSSPAA